MYIGHALLAFTLAAAIARWAGVRDRMVLWVGLAAAGFALVPDIDSASTLWAVLQAGPATVFPTTAYVWTVEGWFVHRSLTHSLVVGTATAGLCFLAASTIRTGSVASRVSNGTVAAAIGCTMIALGYATDGNLGVATMALYVGAALVVTLLARRAGLTPRQVGSVAAIGLLSHPFGDVFMGRPPAFFYPILSGPSVEKIALAPDPTVNLVGLFALEVVLAWSVIWIITRTNDDALSSHIEWRATLGFGFAAAVLYIRPPTLDVAYHFAMGTIATGAVLGFGPTILDRTPTRTGYLTPIATGLAAVTVAVAGYLIAYLVYAPR